MSRKSILKQKDIQNEFCKTMEELRQIWDEIGLPDDQMDDRGDKVIFHVRDLLDNMISEEQQLRKTLLSNIVQFRLEIDELCIQLDTSIEVPPDDADLSILQRDKILRTKLSALEEIRNNRRRTLKVYKKEEQTLCDQLCSTPYYIPSGCIPSKQQLHNLKEHIEALKTEKSRRWEVYKQTKTEILTIYEQLDLLPDTTFAHELVTEVADSFVLSSGNMDELKELYDDLDRKKTDADLVAKELWERVYQLWDALDIPANYQADVKRRAPGFKSAHIKELEKELNRLQEMKLANLQQLTERARSEIATLWTKSYFSKDQRHAFTPAYDENYTEELLDAHEEELARLHAFYEEHKELFMKVKKWQDLFNRMIVLETKEGDVHRLENRGGKLLQEEKERKLIRKQLPRIEESLLKDIDTWEQRHHSDFFVEGIKYKDYVSSQWKAFEERKNTEKTQRKMKKRDELRSDMAFGTTPKTPTKRRFIGMTTKNSASGNVSKRPRNGLESTYRSTAASFMSVKSPGRPPIGTPKTRLTKKAPLKTRRIAQGNLDNQLYQASVETASTSTGMSIKSMPNPERSYADFPLSTTVVSADIPPPPRFGEIDETPYCEFVHQITRSAQVNKVRSSAVADNIIRK